ncbi:MAG: D-alanine--D-alanine ligase [Bacteroidales bacterium]|nr:D-alanine--D-alanine ligase [Bacteroidales bacterium]
MKKVALVMGGYSDEKVISIASGKQVYASLDRTKYTVYQILIDTTGWHYLHDDGSQSPVDKNDFSIVDNGQRITFDLAFIIIHGTPGENGMMQGYFDMIGLPYTTCGFYTSALTFNKGYCNPVVRSFGVVSVAESVVLLAGQNIDEEDLIAKLGLPLFVKPASGGSSVATTKVKSREQLRPAIEWAFEKDNAVMVEQFISGREIDCGVIRANGQLHVFPVTELVPKGGHEFFDYEAKYNGFADELTPAPIDDSISQHIQQVSAQLYDLLNCRGMVRFDFIYNTDHGELFFLEVNTIPGQSAESIVPKQARCVGISTSELYDMIIDCAQ